jgi:hypothetical protein
MDRTQSVRSGISQDARGSQTSTIVRDFMRESVERAGKEKTERIFLIRKVVRPQLERERRFEDAESAARPCAAQESDRQGACR